jgi:hypothetical protein
MIGAGNDDESVRLTGPRQGFVHFALEHQQRNLEVRRMQARRIALQLGRIGSDLPLDGAPGAMGGSR